MAAVLRRVGYAWVDGWRIDGGCVLFSLAWHSNRSSECIEEYNFDSGLRTQGLLGPELGSLFAKETQSIEGASGGDIFEDGHRYTIADSKFRFDQLNDSEVRYNLQSAVPVHLPYKYSWIPIGNSPEYPVGLLRSYPRSFAVHYKHRTAYPTPILGGRDIIGFMIPTPKKLDRDRLSVPDYATIPPLNVPLRQLISYRFAGTGRHGRSKLNRDHRQAVIGDHRDSTAAELHTEDHRIGPRNTVSTCW
ncbi:hypothetical protein B0H12DRAFT_1076902 [Mycena haematopus]|nr:hypothetical protein B0H12DRAFT_1076902 [Mycena haematopus]